MLPSRNLSKSKHHLIHQCPEYLIQIGCMEALYANSAGLEVKIGETNYIELWVVKGENEHLTVLDLS